MNPKNKSNLSNADKPNLVVRIFQKLSGMVVGLFEPEEVEVTFKEEGNKSSYTYTKVPQKQAA